MTTGPGEQSFEAVPPTAEEIIRLSEENNATLQRLAQMGVPVGQDQITNVRLQLLTEVLLGSIDDPRRLAYEYRVQTMCAQALADLGAQARRAQLLRGVSTRPERTPRER